MLTERQKTLMHRGGAAIVAFCAGVAFDHGLSPDELSESGDLLEQYGDAFLAQIDVLEGDASSLSPDDLRAALAAAKRAGDEVLVAELTAALRSRKGRAS